MGRNFQNIDLETLELELMWISFVVYEVTCITSLIFARIWLPSSNTIVTGLRMESGPRNAFFSQAIFARAPKFKWFPKTKQAQQVNVWLCRPPCGNSLNVVKCEKQTDKGKTKNNNGDSPVLTWSVLYWNDLLSFLVLHNWADSVWVHMLKPQTRSIYSKKATEALWTARKCFVFLRARNVTGSNTQSVNALQTHLCRYPGGMMFSAPYTKDSKHAQPQEHLALKQ